jgi:AraC-like DNA-binding protein
MSQTMTIDNKKLLVDANVLVQINSGQSHGPSGAGQMQRMSGILIDKSYLQSLARQIYCNTDFYFDNTSFSDTQELIRLMRTTIEEAGSNREGKLFMLESLCTQIDITLLRKAKNGRLTGKHNDKAYDKNGIKKVIDYFREHYGNNSYSFLEIADIANLSPYHLIRAFKQQTGKTPYEYLVDLKIDKAKELLENYRYSVTEICFLCGFNNHSHFTTLFKRKVGVPPSEYRNIVASRVRT